MRKRELIRRLPLLSRLSRRLDALEAESRRLRGYLWQATVCDVSTLTEKVGRESDAAERPVPPAILRDLVTGTDDLGWFLRSGAFPGHLHGADRNPLAIEWCRRNLPFARFEVNAPAPPLAHADGTFDAIYAFSVFTHLTTEMQAAWMQEMWRLLKPGGCLMLSLHGTSYRRHLPRTQRRSFQAGQVVVLDTGVEGSNGCNAFHPEAYVRGTLSRGFRVLEFVPSGAKGNPTQDLYVLRRTEAEADAPTL